MTVGGIEGPGNIVVRLIGNGCACGVKDDFCLLKRSVVDAEGYRIPFLLASLKVNGFKIIIKSRSSDRCYAFRNVNACEAFAADKGRVADFG